MNFLIIMIRNLLILGMFLPIQAQEPTPLIPFISQKKGVQKAELEFTKRLLGANLSPLKTLSVSEVIAFNGLHHLSAFKPKRLRNEDNNLTKENPPKMNPGNKIFRFALELGALGAMGWWGYEQADGAGRYALMAGIPIAAAMAWGVFTVPSDPSRGQDGLVHVSGVTRLLLEGTIFGFATWALHDLGEDALAVGLGSAVVLHYTLSFDRLKWLVKQ